MMQTFLPYDDFKLCAKVLDNKRLGKQRVECKQILSALQPDSNSGWKNHPAVLMWKGYEKSLKYYMNCMVEEWVSRGYKNTMEFNDDAEDKVPEWVDSKLIFSHRANLQKKDMKHYPWIGIDTDAPYWWPTGLKNKKMNNLMLEYYNKWNSKSLI